MNLSNVSFIMQLGMSSLHSAVKRDYFEVFAELLDSGADLYVRDEVRKFFLFLKYILHYIALKFPLSILVCLNLGNICCICL